MCNEEQRQKYQNPQKAARVKSMTRRCLPSAVSEEPIDMEAEPTISTNHEGDLLER
jgi:hypothetical protein